MYWCGSSCPARCLAGKQSAPRLENNFLQLRLGGRDSVPSSPTDTKHSPHCPKYDTFGFLQCLSQTTPPSAFSLDFFFSVRNASHSGEKKNNQKTTVSIVSKTCLLSARSVYRAPVSSQLPLQTEKPETLWEVIFQSTKMGALEISANDKMNHCSPKQRPRFELLALRSCVG